MANNKDVYYFSHDSNARNDEKILMFRAEHGWEGYGLYWALVEMMFESNETCLYHSKIKGIAAGYNIDITLLQNVINTCITEQLFVSDGEKFWSESLRRRKAAFHASREKKSKAGKKGMALRWGKSEKSASDNTVITENNKVITENNKVKESKVNKRKEKEKKSTKDLLSELPGSDGEKTPEEPVFKKESAAYRGANYLRGMIMGNNPRAKVPDDKEDDSLMQKWALEMDRLHRLGPPGGTKGYTWNEIKAIIDFCMDDSFWRANILSPSKLRKQVVILENKMKERDKVGKAGSAPKPGYRPSEHDWSKEPKDRI